MSDSPQEEGAWIRLQRRWAAARKKADEDWCWGWQRYFVDQAGLMRCREMMLGSPRRIALAHPGETFEKVEA